MGGKSKSQTTGYKYYMGLLMGLCHGPIDALLEIRAGDRTAWKGEQDASGSIPVNAPKLFGGDEKEGGVVGMLDVQMGESTQLENDYLVTQLGSGRPAYRGILTLVFRAVLAAERSLFGADSAKILSGMKLGGGGHITSNNPYIKPWAFKVRRILMGWKGGTAWYAAKAPIVLAEGAGSAPTGNVWMAVDNNIGNVYVGEYDGSPWTLQSNDYSGVMGGPHLRVGSTLYLGAIIQYCDVSDVSDWTTLGGSDNSSVLKMASDGTYVYLARGTSVGHLGRFTLPSGSVSIPFASTDSWADTLTVWQGDLYIFSVIDNRVKVSTDNGASYTDKTEYRATGVTGQAPKAASNDDIIVVAYSDNAGVGPVKVAWSEDGCSTWTTVTPPITADSNPTVADCVWTGTEFILCTNTGTNVGRTAYSADGKTWYAGTTLKDCAYVTVGIGKSVIATTEVNLYETMDGGATWTEMPEIVSSVNTGHTAFIYWLGETTSGDYVPSVKAMNPAHIVYECLTNSEWGMGYDSSIIDSASFTAAADLFFAEGLGLCLQWMRQESIEGFIKLVMDHCGGVTVEDRTTGLIQLKPLRGNYTVGSLPHFSSELGNVIELRRFERASVTDTINEVSVSYTDVVTGKTGSVAVQNLAAVQASGRVISQSVDYPGLPTMDLALRTAMRDLKAYTSGLARVHLTVNRSGYALTPGDVIRFSWLPDGIDQMVLRIVDVDYGSLVDGKVQLECLEDVFGLPATTYVAQQATGWIEPDSTALAPAATTAFEAPFRELLASIGRSETLALATDAGYVAAVAARAPGFNLCYELYTRTGTDPYTDTGTGDWCPSGTITANITAAATSITLTAADGIEQVAVGSLAMLGTGATAEMVRVETVDPDTLVLTIARGCLDTTPKPWALGTRFWAIDDASTGSTTEYVTTEVVDVKLLTRTSTELLGLGSVSSTPVTMNQRQIRPYPPGLLRFLDDLNTVTGLAYPVELAGALTASWAHRDRLLQDDQIIDESAASIGPEAGTTYTVRYYQPPATLVNTESALSGTSATPYTFAADGPAEITIEASRAGFASWQLAYHAFDYYRFPRITTVAGEPRITDDGSARKVI